ncbi:redoxin domain-containing protein [Niabella yanshanensis]|uniref:Redoxin domain-containing protein n=1 Tax=Niabella yanshanensis TaxID=577386 RepID=A0ABZ0W9B8_9BACT|nr:redoxin domain-containing protein [Niabella yanshanensis]WQD39193.1 redoxin domain-containing protein [Niabella yanshanensis]
MNKKITLTSVMAILCICLSAQRPQVTTLPVNERLSNLVINNLINYPGDTASINTLTGNNSKMLLIDFWFTSCAPCIKQIPKLDSLQQQFKDQLQILMVTFEPDSLVIPFITKWEQRHCKKLSVPVATADTLLQAHFNQGSRPNYAFIAADRVNMGYTSKAFINATVIKEVLAKMKEEVNLRGYQRNPQQ